MRAFRVFGTSRRAAAERVDGVTMLTCDVTDDASVAKLADEVLTKAGRIDLLVNNAGFGLLGAAEESSSAEAQALFDVNVFGVIRVTNAVLPAMRRQGKGRIVIARAGRQSRSCARRWSYPDRRPPT
jgi:NAD(P)-dependent dehydrogenase (short-subunit alcohol dehydrogenase family)